MLLKKIVIFWDRKRYYRTEMISGSICKACKNWQALECSGYCQEVNEMFPHKRMGYVTEKAKTNT